MAESRLNAVTGAFGYTGRYIAERLLRQGERVRALTGRPAAASPFGEAVAAYPLDFADGGRLAYSLQGVEVLYNTYWVRFARGGLDHARATANLQTLIGAAALAGVGRIVHISITNAAADSPLPYFRGKALVEEALRRAGEEFGLRYSIIRPTVVFGREDILINNIAWFLRRFPLFPIGGDGQYPVQPVYVDDVARLAVAAADAGGSVALDAVGPEQFSFDELVRLVADAVGSRARLLHLPPGMTLTAARLAGLLVRDVTLTKDELDGLMAGHLVSANPPTGAAKFSGWLRENGATLGRRYASDLTRHYRR